MNNFISPAEAKKMGINIKFRRIKRLGRPAKVYGKRQRGWVERPL